MLDRTGLKGEYDFTIEYAGDPNEPGPIVSPNTSGSGGGFFNPFTGLSPSTLSAALKDVGLQFESMKARVEILVIDHVEKPAGN